MPNVTMPNGFVVRDVPPGTTQQQLLARLKSAGYDTAELMTPPQQKGVVEDYLEEVPLVGGLLTGAADIGLAGIQGAAGTIGAATEAFGARNSVSSFFDDIAKGAGDLISAEEKGDLAAGQRALKDAEDKGILEQVKAAAYAFSKSPLTMTAQALGSVAPVAAATIGTGGAGGAALGAVIGAGTVKGSIYDAVEQAAVEKGIDPKTAKAMADEAQSYLGGNVDQVALGAALGAVAGRFGLEPAAARIVGKELAESAVQRSIAARAGRGLVAEALPEAAQAGQERMAQNIALQREGYDVPTMRGAAGQAALEGIMGGVPGAALGVFDRAPAAKPTAEEEAPTPEGTSPVSPAMQEAFNNVPPEAEKAVSADLLQRFTKLGFDEETARTIVGNMQLQKEAAARQAAEEETKRREATEARTAGVEMPPEPDIGAPPPVDPEEQAAMERAYAEEVGAPMGEAPGTFRTTTDINGEQRVEEGIIPRAETLTPEAQFAQQMGEAVVSPFEFDGRDYGSYRALEAVRQRTLQEQAKREELLGDTGKLSAYAQSKGISDVEMHRLLADNYKVGQDIVTRLTKKLLGDDMQSAAQAEKTRATKVKFTDITDAPYVEVQPTSAQWMLDNARGAVDTLRSRNPKVLAVVEDLHAQDFTAKEISAATGLDVDTVRDVRMGLGLPEQGRASGSVALATPGDAAQRAAFEAWRDSRAAQPAPSVAPAAPVAPANPQPIDLTPERAGMLLNDPVALSDYEASGGDVDALYDIVEGMYEGPSIKYSRGRRPKDTVTEDMFGALPVQTAPGEELKRDEFNAQRFATDEERAAREQQFAEEMQAGQERALALRDREAANREETLGDIEYALRAQAPENAVYKVQYDPEDANPYKLVAETQLGKKPEEVLKAKTLQDFSDQVYGQMMELTPYTPPTPAGIEQIETRETGEMAEPTIATRMVQDFTAEVDAAREAGQIDNLQRAELLQRLQRPNAYRAEPVSGRPVPNDAIAKLEAEALKAASAERNASAEEKEAATAARKEVNQRLRAAVKNSLLNPARAKLKSMVEMRQDERVGADIRAKEAEATKDIREAREAKIDLKETKVQKYRRGAPKQPGGPPKVISVDRVRSIVGEITKNWKSENPVVVLESVMDVKDPKLLRAIQKDGAYDANGFVAPDGTIYLVADNLLTEQGVRAVLFHEALGHLGLEKLFRNNLDNALVTMYRGNAQLKADTDKWREANPGAYERDPNPLARAVEEVLAERSEAGQLDRSLFQKIAAIVRNFARRMGFPLKISDGDVAAILSMAHDKIVNGDAESTVVKGLRYIMAWHGSPHDFNKFSTSKIGTEDVGITAKYSRGKNRKKVVDAIAGLSAGRRRVNDTLSTYGMMDGIEEATKATPKLRDAVAFAEDSTSPLRRAALASMPTSGITGWLQRKAPKVAEVAEQLVDVVRKMNGLRVNMLAAGDSIVRDMDDFVRKYGSETLARAQFTNRINEIDFLAFDTQKEALAKHRLIKALEADLLANSNNKAETRKLIDAIKEQAATEGDKTSVLKDKVNLSAPIKVQLNKLSKLAVDADKVALKVKQLAAISQRIRDSYAIKADLAKQKGGLELYKAERQYHKDILEARQALLDERIERGLGKEQAIRIRDIRARMMRELQSPTERQKAGDLFWDLDADLFDKEYFPMLRDGQYWLRVNEDLSKGREEQFYVFNSARELAQGRREVAKRLKENPEDSKVFKEGNDIGELQNTLRESDALMQRVFDIVGKARSEYNESGDIDMRQLLDSIYQTWLMTTPERSARRHFMHAKMIAGFSPDTLGNLQQQISTNANELTKLAYAGRVRTAVSALKDTINDPERPVSEQTMLGDFARELELRAEQELSPPEPGALNTFVNALNRFSFYYYLTSAKTALTNFANIPIRVVPRFWREYGYVEGTAMWMKYMKMWDSLGRVKLDRTNMRFGDYLDAVMPNVNGSDFVKNSDDLQWAMKAGTERGILMTTADTMVHNERNNPKAVLTGKLADVAANTGKVMSFLFTGTENISRQATFYMAFELEMKKQKKDNPTMPLEERREAALQKAMRIVDDTIGNFADWERPRIAKGDLTRAFFLFKMHPILQTKFMVGAFRDIIAAPLRGALRRATGRGKMTEQDTAYVAGALKEFSGVLMMGGLLGGLTALPFYTMMAHALAEGFDQEDDDDVRKLLGIDPRTAYDADIMFRRWIMEHLGTPEKGDVDLADILIGGVPGAMTDTEISSTLSLDLVNMWYREPIAGDSLESTMVAAVIANVAGLGMVSSMLKAYEDFDKGNIDDGLKKLLPAFFRAPVAAAFNEAQGVQTRKGDVIIPKEDITGADTFRSALGARSARLARWQDYYITAKKNEDKINGEKVDILDELERKMDSGEIATQADFKKFWDETVVPFNRTYPDSDFIITMDSIKRSLKGRAEREARTEQGMLVSKKSPIQERTSAAIFKP
jgi:hypothetical protein